MNLMGVISCLLVLTVASTAAEKKPEPVPIRGQRELFVEDSLIDHLEGAAQLRLHQPVPRQIAITHDAPWEGNASAYHNIFHDGQRFRMYYRAWHILEKNNQLFTGPESLCYAESDDGISWRKPELGLQEFEGSKSNNIVLSPAWAARYGVSLQAPAVFFDTNPQAAPAARFKMFLISHDPLGMRPFQSADGFDWSPITDSPTITAGAFDSHNLAFWDADRGEYRAFWRTFTGGETTAKAWKPEGIRAIRTATSPDLIHWDHQADLNYGNAPEVQLYENGVAPYHRAPHLMIGLPVRYVDRGIVRESTVAEDGSDRLTDARIQEWSTSLKALPDFPQRAVRAKLTERYGSAITESLLMASRDGVRFKRWEEAFLRPGLERSGTWNYGQHMVGWSVLETKSEWDDAPPELSIYTTEGYWIGKGTSLRRYSLRLDGFVAVNAPLRGGELVTKPVVFSGQSLSVNLSTSAAGTLQVELQSPAGEPLPGFTLADCEEVFGDTVDRRVTWKSSRKLADLVGQPIRIRFVLSDADLYSYQFVE